jgi:hypothetical protein
VAARARCSGALRAGAARAQRRGGCAAAACARGRSRSLETVSAPPLCRCRCAAAAAPPPLRAGARARPRRTHTHAPAAARAPAWPDRAPAAPNPLTATLQNSHACAGPLYTPLSHIAFLLRFPRSSCHDLPFLLLFAAFWGGVIAIAATGFKQGVPQTLLYGLDYSGHVCGKNNKARGKTLCVCGRCACVW